MKLTFNKYEKLKSKKLIKLLFEKGKRISVFPIMLMYLKIDHETNYLFQAGVTVSKRNFKRAVDRNRIKRLLRESYRLNKPFLYEKLSEKYIFMFIYLGKEEIEFQLLENKMKKVLDNFIKVELKE